MKPEALAYLLKKDGKGSQGRLAKFVGVSPSDVSRWASGERGIGSKTYPEIKTKIASYFHVPETLLDKNEKQVEQFFINKKNDLQSDMTEVPGVYVALGERLLKKVANKAKDNDVEIEEYIKFLCIQAVG